MRYTKEQIEFCISILKEESCNHTRICPECFLRSKCDNNYEILSFCEKPYILPSKRSAIQTIKEILYEI